MRTLLGMTAVLFAAFGIAAGAAQAAEIIILASQGNISGARDLGAGFERASGHKVIARQERNVLDTVNARTPADVVIANPPVIDNLIREGKVVGNRVDFARAGIGVAVKEGAPKPQLRNTEDFIRVLRNAKSIGYSTVGSGLMAANIIKDLVSPRSSRRGRNFSTASRPPRRWRAARSRSRCSRSTSSCRSRAPSSAGRCRPNCSNTIILPSACSPSPRSARRRPRW
jgi:hypothetical protein